VNYVLYTCIVMFLFGFCRSPVKMSGVSFSKSRQAKDKYDVLFNTRSKLSIVQKLAFAFDDKLLEQDVIKSLDEIHQDVREYQRVSVIILLKLFY